MRLVYFGSGSFGLPTLERLSRVHDVALVVSQPDRPAQLDRTVRPDEATMRAWSALLVAHRRLTAEMDRELRERVGMDLDEYDVLHQLQRAGRPVRMGELAAWCGSIALSVLAIESWNRVMRYAPPQDTRPATAETALIASIGDSLAVRAERIAASDPFRLVRHPSPVAYHPELEGAPPPPPALPKPALTLAGILGGPPWQAILEGIPGRDGPLVVRAGDRVGELTVRSVRRDTVVIAGLDTVWKLTVRRTWR